MGLLNLLIHDPVAFVLVAVPLLYAIIFHELAHGWAAFQMGDSTAKDLGRLSLNPMRHLDPVGTIMLFFVGFGWAKPVPVNFARLKEKRLGMILVSSAGIITNMLLATLALFIYKLLGLSPASTPAKLLYFFARINIILAAINLIPIPPLDGSKILMSVAPQNIQMAMMRLERFGFFILIGLLWFGVLDPVIDFFQWLILSLISVLVS